MVAVEVAEMETTIHTLREQVRDLERTVAALEAENAMLQSRCEKAEDAAMTELVRSTQMKQVMTSMSAMLIDGLRKMEEAVDEERRTRAEKEARRLEQERLLGVGGEDAPFGAAPVAEPPVLGPQQADVLGESSTLDKLAPATFQTDLESDLQRLAALGETDDKR